MIRWLPPPASSVTARSADDLLESVMSVVMPAREGVFNVGRRELRYTVEAKVKYVYVDQQLQETPLFV
jgi:hypothetical protein